MYLYLCIYNFIIINERIIVSISLSFSHLIEFDFCTYSCHSIMSAKHTLKFYYFDLRGRGEHIRQLLKLADVPFEDVVITSDQWPTYKSRKYLN